MKKKATEDQFSEVLTKALKEALERIEALESRLNAANGKKVKI